jgi:hypothetical protein
MVARVGSPTQSLASQNQNALKIKNTNNFQATKLNIINKFYQKNSLEIFKQMFF